ncbi:MAG TPA: patatin-like phospholipase family protein [Longimicrobiales bacterium]|nr:patatin-like phospholipase family protein [Longimicrobiales bacterium]
MPPTPLPPIRWLRRPPGCRLRGPVALAACTAILATPAARPPPAAAQQGPDSIPFGIVVSGGTSRGSWLAGATWGMLHALRTAGSEDASGARSPAYVLSAMTGASAGNINVLATMVDYCDEHASANPAESQSWHIWTQVGFDELLPDTLSSVRPDDGLFTRTFIESTIYPVMERRLTEVTPTGSCEAGVSLGITVSRLTPDRFAIPRFPLEARVQRMTLPFRAEVARSGATRRLVFTPPDTGTARRRSLGKRLLLPADEDGHLPIRTLLDAASASSAFPGAFAPVLLRYRDADDPDDVLREAAFGDGGVFDNNPIALLEGMMESRLGADSTMHIVYIDPDFPLREGTSGVAVAASETDDRGVGGLSAFLQLASGAITAGREYELQAYLRAVARLREAGRPLPDVRVLPRSRPIFGNYLFAFGGFLSHTFRRHDFFLGLYDGARFAASDLLCSAPDDGGCTGRTLATLLSSVELEGGGKALVGRWFAEDFEDTSYPPVTGDVGEDAALLSAVAEAIARAPPDAPPDSCGGGIIGQLLCREHILGLADELKARGVVPLVERGAAVTTWEVPGGTRSDPDSALAALAENPRRFFANRIERLLEQAVEVEIARAAGDSLVHLREELKVMRLLSSLITVRHTASIDLDPSSVPDRVRIWRDPGRLGAWAHLLPYFASASLLEPGIEFGYSPMVYLSENRFTLSVPVVPFSIQRPEADASAASDGDLKLSAMGLGLGFRPRQFWTRPGVEVHFLQYVVWGDRADRWVPAVQVVVDLLDRKLRIAGKRYFADAALGLGRDGYAFEVGIQDLNGLIYWLTR